MSDAPMTPRYVKFLLEESARQGVSVDREVAELVAALGRKLEEATEGVMNELNK